jgi:hypothetical protein
VLQAARNLDRGNGNGAAKICAHDHGGLKSGLEKASTPGLGVKLQVYPGDASGLDRERGKVAKKKFPADATQKGLLVILVFLGSFDACPEAKDAYSLTNASSGRRPQNWKYQNFH